MSKIKQAKETVVFFINDGVVDQCTLYDKMLESRDETTTPRGVGPRLFIEKLSVDVDEDDFEDDDNKEQAFHVEIGYKTTTKEDFEQGHRDGLYVLTYFEIASWGHGGSNYQRLGVDHRFLTEQEAEEELFEYLEHDFENDWDNSSNIFYTREEAEEILKERNEI
jgi:hypothetical protein